MLGNNNTIVAIDKPVQENCGIAATFSRKYSKHLPLVLTAASGVQHRGQQGAGLAMKTRQGLVKYKRNGLLKDIFTDSLVNKLNKQSRWIIVHCRYGTHGGYNVDNLQPCVETSSSGEKIAVIHNGEFVAVDKLRKKVEKLLFNALDKQASDTYVFTKSLAYSEGKHWDEKVVRCLKDAKGAFSLLIGIDNTLYVARDKFGVRPLYYGNINNSDWLVASETHSFDKVGIGTYGEVKKGEIIKMSKHGLTTLQGASKTRRHFCDFELAYFSRPDSCFPNGNKKGVGNWSSFAAFRERCGYVLAEESPIADCSFVVGLPDSGISVAMGYANKLKLPYRQMIIRDHFDHDETQRLFMQDNHMELIGNKVLNKLSLIPDKTIWKGAKVIVGDDSIVRGNVSRQITRAIMSLGAKEVHWIVGFPPIKYPCHLGVSIRTDGELIASKYNGDPKKIARDIGATSVNYISSIGFIKAKLSERVNRPRNAKEIFLRNGGCGGCITKLYPKSKKGEYYFN